ncbi:MAG: acylphosphatase [Candidatus Brocadiae bacterium]|nr:acylphosphatase [Candidatus Brocadiia bacterium]
MAEGEEMVRAHVVISGRVQGVWFRGTTHEEARALGLTGWVRNRWDGSVEAVFEGPRGKVRRMVAWCHRGPRLAQVTSVDLKWEEATGEFSRFSVAY